MATLHTPVRQPFGVLDSSKIRNLQSIKNRQNAIVPSSAPSLKRSHASSDLSDSENVDPFQYQASKRKRVEGENDIAKPVNYVLKSSATKPIIKPRSRISHSSPTSLPQTPRLDTAPTTVSSAPAPAGRSPIKSKRSGILSNHRTRLNAPALGGSNRAPLSLAAALQGTLAGKKQKKRARSGSLEEANPKSWFFDIFEENPEQEKTSLELWGTMAKTGNLDISDDECSPKKARAEEYTEEEKNKENIAPDAAFQYTSSSAPAISRKDLMTDETRSPLGNLKASDYYGEGCDATSVVLVNDDEGFRYLKTLTTQKHLHRRLTSKPQPHSP